LIYFLKRIGGDWKRRKWTGSERSGEERNGRDWFLIKK